MTTLKIARVALTASLLGAVLVSQPIASHADSISPLALSECPSGNFCVWAGTNFSGAMQRISTTNAYREISLAATKSYYNNRTKRTWLHDSPDGSGSTVCIGPGAQKVITTGWQTTAEAAYLATITNC